MDNSGAGAAGGPCVAGRLRPVDGNNPLEKRRPRAPWQAYAARSTTRSPALTMSCLLPLWESTAIAADVAAATTDRAGLAARQQRRLARLLRAAVKGSALYRELYAPWLQAGQDPGSLPLAELPVVHKRQLMARFADWVTRPRRWSWPPCGGSPPTPPALPSPGWAATPCGKAPAAAASPRSSCRTRRPWRSTTRLRPCGGPSAARGWRAGWTPWGWVSAWSSWAPPAGISPAPCRWSGCAHLHPALAASVHSLSFLQPAEALVHQLNQWAPTVVATYPTAAVLLAEEQAAGRLAVSPREVWTGGETLTPGMRRFIEASFGCQVATSYGSSEFLTLAGECAQGRLHVNADWDCCCEPVDEAGPTGAHGPPQQLGAADQPGQPGAAADPPPMRLGDRVTLHAAATCPCGSALPVIEVQGREDDLPDPAGRPRRPLGAAAAAGAFHRAGGRRRPVRLPAGAGLTPGAVAEHWRGRPRCAAPACSGRAVC